jgi:hypothetical protein
MAIPDIIKYEQILHKGRRLARAWSLAHVVGPVLAERLPHLFPTPPVVRVLNGQGLTNFTLQVRSAAGEDLILRLTECLRSGGAVEGSHAGHEKERYVLEHLRGAPFVPHILPDGAGRITVRLPREDPVEFNFLLQRYLPFPSAARCRSRLNRTRCLEQLGALAREIHGVSVEGFGISFDPHKGRFEHDSHADFINEKMERLENAPISGAMRGWILSRAERLRAMQPESQLFHRDLLGNWGNFLVDAEGAVRGVIDWEFSGSGAAFHYEVASMLYVLARDGHPPDVVQHDLHAVLRGYGVPFAHYQRELEWDVETIVLLNSISALLRFQKLKDSGREQQEPWRKLFAERALAICDSSYRNDTISPALPQRLRAAG